MDATLPSAFDETTTADTAPDALLADARHDRVRAHTDPGINAAIDAQTAHFLRLYAKADPAEIAYRLDELDREWDVERVLEANAATVSLAGLVLGTFGSRKWFVLPTVVAGFLLLHAVQGWCPPLPALRRLGVRTRKEIERERYALKALRGDFGEFNPNDQADVQKLLDKLDQ